MVIALPLARILALKSNQKVNKSIHIYIYKQQHNKKATTPKFHVGDQVLVYFPQVETGKNCKLFYQWQST